METLKTPEDIIAGAITHAIGETLGHEANSELNSTGKNKNVRKTQPKSKKVSPRTTILTRLGSKKPAALIVASFLVFTVVKYIGSDHSDSKKEGSSAATQNPPAFTQTQNATQQTTSDVHISFYVSDKDKVSGVVTEQRHNKAPVIDKSIDTKIFTPVSKPEQVTYVVAPLPAINDDSELTPINKLQNDEAHSSQNEAKQTWSDKAAADPSFTSTKNQFLNINQ